MPVEKHHPITGALYQQDGENVRVSQAERSGLFTKAGRWLEGDLRHADPLMCMWIGAGSPTVGTMKTLFSNTGET
jgi:hypothetical protein